MLKKKVSGIILILVLTSMSTLAFNIHIIKTCGTSYTNADRSVDGIGDTTYGIDEGIQDNYSLVNLESLPWGNWSHYHNYSEIVATLLYLNETYPNVVDMFPIGKSWQNRDIYCIRLTNESDTQPKPKVFFVGYHHAREPITAELVLYFTVDAATKFGTNETITNMLNCSEIYIVPALNVDGFDALERNDWQRKNARPIDEDGDGLFDEDPPDDEDGDGYIEDLYYWDGIDYYFIRWEGLDDDGDGEYNEDWIGGVDLNRNYPISWENASSDPSSSVYRGSSPFSEPETQAIRDLALEHNFTYAISFHSGTELILYPWGYTDDPPPDEIILREIAQDLSSITGGTTYQQVCGLYKCYGVWDDWMYGNRSTFAFTCEIYGNDSAWQYEPGPEPYTWWERGILQAFNPDPNDIETVIQRWLPVFTYTTNRAIAEAHDIATTNVIASKTAVGQGYSLDIKITSVNHGVFTETFNVTAYANTTVIGMAEVTLTAGNSTVITFTWNTSGFVKGNYTISAVADTVGGETDTDDNTHVADEQVCISIPGDLDCDRDVDLYDAVKLLVHYGAKAGQPEYDSICDIDGDGDIDLYDAVKLLTNYGKKDP
jgi:hypothetical protein